MVPGATIEEAIKATRTLLAQANLKDVEVTIDPSEITETTGAISVHVSIPFAKNCWFFKTWSESYNVSSDVTLLCERVPLIQLTGLPDIIKKSKGGGGKGKVNL